MSTFTENQATGLLASKMLKRLAGVTNHRPTWPQESGVNGNPRRPHKAAFPRASKIKLFVVNSKREVYRPGWPSGASQINDNTFFRRHEMIKSRLGIIAVLLISLALGACVKNPDTGEPEPDFDTIAGITQATSQSLAFELLKYLHTNKPDDVNQVFAEFVTGITIIQRYADGDITAGETVVSVVDIFQRIQARFDIPDSPITVFVTGTVASIAGALNMVLTEIPENAALILTAVGNGLNAGLEDYVAWASAQAGTEVMP